MVLAITKSFASLTFAWLALANDANVSRVSEERPFYFYQIYGSYSFTEMPLELIYEAQQGSFCHYTAKIASEYAAERY